MTGQTFVTEKVRYMDETNVGIIILAAGASTRLGEPKQLLTFQNKTLISRAVETSINSKCVNTAVILGANVETIKKEIEDFPINICTNENWKTGMASSIKCGLDLLLSEQKKLNAVLILLCDQPFIESKHINQLLKTFEQTNKDIVATEYKNTIGVPALFSSKLFDKLLKLEGDKGARQIIKTNPDLLQTIPIPEAEFDIDTVEDYQKLINST